MISDVHRTLLGTDDSVMQTCVMARRCPVVDLVAGIAMSMHSSMVVVATTMNGLMNRQSNGMQYNSVQCNETMRVESDPMQLRWCEFVVLTV